MQTEGQRETKKCGWGRIHRGCHKVAVKEMQSLTGKWVPICNYHLNLKQHNNASNPWGGLLPITTREFEA